MDERQPQDPDPSAPRPRTPGGLRVGIIGGSGLDDPAILAGARDESVTTPWGEPSSPLRHGAVEGVACVLLARHGRAHTIPPTHVDNRANLHALRAAGCTHVLATTAVGSLREDIGRGDLVVLDQFLDFTRRRPLTFHERFAPGRAVHTPMADPFDAGLRERLIAAARTLGLRHHPAGTVVTIEGPRFSTRAESRMFRAWGADVINMSTAPECALAVEAGLPYAAVAMATDYDAWKEDEAPVTWDEITRIFAANVDRVVRLLVRTIASLEPGPRAPA
jgi:5'-methylthioadenosine phosphorylase